MFRPSIVARCDEWPDAEAPEKKSSPPLERGRDCARRPPVLRHSPVALPLGTRAGGLLPRHVLRGEPPAAGVPTQARDIAGVCGTERIAATVRPDDVRRGLLPTIPASAGESRGH